MSPQSSVLFKVILLEMRLNHKPTFGDSMSVLCSWLLPAPINFCCFSSNTFGPDALYHSVNKIAWGNCIMYAIVYRSLVKYCLLSIVLGLVFSTLTNNFLETNFSLQHIVYSLLTLVQSDARDNEWTKHLFCLQKWNTR